MPRGHRRPAVAVTTALGRRIRELREERGIAQAELARRVGSSASHLNKLEAGQKAATVTTLAAVAKALGVELADLFPGRNVQQPVGNPPDPLWVKLAGELRERNRDYLVLVKDALRLLDRARDGAH